MKHTTDGKDTDKNFCYHTIIDPEYHDFSHDLIEI